MAVAPALAAVTAFKKLSDGAQYTVDGGTLRIQFWSPETVRVTFAASNEIPEIKSLSVVAKPEKVSLKRQENDQAFTLASSNFKVKIDKQSGVVTFLDLADHVLLQESAQGRRIQSATVAGAAVTSCAQTFDTALDERLLRPRSTPKRDVELRCQRRQCQARPSQHGRGDSGDYFEQGLHDPLG